MSRIVIGTYGTGIGMQNGGGLLAVNMKQTVKIRA